MTLSTSEQAAKDAAHKANDSNPSPAGNPVMSYIDMVGQAADYMLTHPISDIANAFSIFAGLVTGNGKAALAANDRMIGFVNSNPVASLKAWTQRQVASIEHQIFALQVYLTQLIALRVKELQAELTAAIATERARRRHGDLDAERLARREIAALHHLIEREAASAYRGGFQGRIGVISRVADYLAAHNPVVRELAGRLISGALDLASVDDPIARIALNFVIRHIIDRLGIDKVAGRALSDLMAPLLDNPRPHDLPGVIRDVSARLAALEGQQAQFWTDGGAEVEQAGREWSAITSPLVDAALIGWLAQAATDPQRWARELTAATEPVMNGVKDVMTALIREG